MHVSEYEVPNTADDLSPDNPTMSGAATTDMQRVVKMC